MRAVRTVLEKISKPETLAGVCFIQIKGYTSKRINNEACN
jgi:hypothetical protein